MARSSLPITDYNLEALDAFLMSERSPEDSMQLPELDGFLTGIAVGPGTIPIQEWMPVIWGGKDPQFASTDETSLIIGTIMGRYSEIIANLDAGPDSFDPLFDEGPEGDVMVTDWAIGFIDAVMLRAKAWEALIRDDEMAVVFWPMLLLGADDPDHPPFGAPTVPVDALAALYDDAEAIITECIFRIRAFWRARRRKPLPEARPERRRQDSRRRR